MKRTFVSLILFGTLVFCTSLASAQDEINRFEVFAGYTYLNTDLSDLSDESDGFIESRSSGHGFNGSVTGNFHKYVGAKFDYSFHSGDVKFDEDLVSDTSTGVDIRTHQFLFGIQAKNNKKDGPRFKPFAHVMAGVARQTIDFGDVFDDVIIKTRLRPLAPGGVETCIDCTVSFTDFAMVFGGGLDVKVHKNVDIRVFQIDYNPIFRRDREFDDDFFGTIPGTTQNNLRLSFGVVIH